MEFHWTKFGKDLKTYRKRHGLTLRECEKSMPVGKATLSRAENGKPISAPDLIFLCEWIRRQPKNYAVSAPRPR